MKTLEIEAYTPPETTVWHNAIEAYMGKSELLSICTEDGSKILIDPVKKLYTIIGKFEEIEITEESIKKFMNNKKISYKLS